MWDRSPPATTKLCDKAPQTRGLTAISITVTHTGLCATWKALLQAWDLWSGWQGITIPHVFPDKQGTQGTVLLTVVADVQKELLELWAQDWVTATSLTPHGLTPAPWVPYPDLAGVEDHTPSPTGRTVVSLGRGHRDRRDGMLGRIMQLAHPHRGNVPSLRADLSLNHVPPHCSTPSSSAISEGATSSHVGSRRDASNRSGLFLLFTG